MDHNDQIEYAINHTELIRPPRQSLRTFGNTNVHYYLLTEPMDTANETRIREGQVVAEKPKIVTADYLLNAFDGFGDDAYNQAQAMLSRFDFSPDIMEYKYRNEIGNSWVLADNISDVILRIASKIDDENDMLAAILKAPDDAWQISLMKFIMDMTRSSLPRHINELSSHGLFERKHGVPKFVRDEVEMMFAAVENDNYSVDDLGLKLRSYGVFELYQDRFFSFFNRKR